MKRYLKVIVNAGLLAALWVMPSIWAHGQANQNPEYKKLQKRFKPAELSAIGKELAAATRDGEADARKLYPDSPSDKPSVQSKNRSMRDKMTPKLIEKRKAVIRKKRHLTEDQAYLIETAHYEEMFKK